MPGWRGRRAVAPTLTCSSLLVARAQSRPRASAAAAPSGSNAPLSQSPIMNVLESGGACQNGRERSAEPAGRRWPRDRSDAVPPASTRIHATDPGTVPTMLLAESASRPSSRRATPTRPRLALSRMRSDPRQARHPPASPPLNAQQPLRAAPGPAVNGSGAIWDTRTPAGGPGNVESCPRHPPLPTGGLKSPHTPKKPGRTPL
jgi:hypothetical protein